MVDTIILRIHGTEKYRSLINNLDKLDVKGYNMESMKVKGKDIHKLRRMGVKDDGELIDILKMNGSGQHIMKTKVVKHMNASNHYLLTYFVNYTADYIEFNFSIPKYVHGSNVLLFVDHMGDPAYTYHDSSTLEFNFVRAFDRLERFLHTFFRTEFYFSNIDLRDVEVNRIDVCFNQVFKSKEEALKYLEYQKRQRKKYSREEEGVMNDYATSLMYKTGRYSAKIYHKGTEYAKNDKKEHEKINKVKGQQYFKTKDYQEFADRMLRYELTIRNTMFNYLHKHNLFRTKCPHFTSYLEEYKRVEAVKLRNERIAKKIGTLPDEHKEAYRKQHPYEKISKESRQVHRYVTKLLNQRTFFTLEIDEEAKLYNKQSVDYNCNKARFSKGLLNLCLGKLLDFMHEYQIKELPEEDRIGRLIDSYNAAHTKKLPKSEMLNFYKDLFKIGSFKSTAKIMYMSRATLYRYKQRFKKIGITDNNLIPLTADGIPQAAYDLRAYHTEITYKPQFTCKNRLWDIV